MIMGKKFNIDNPIWSFIGKLVDMLFITLLWVVFSLPLVTIGASTTALYYCSQQLVSNTEEHLAESFVASFRKNFRQSTITWGDFFEWNDPHGGHVSFLLFGHEFSQSHAGCLRCHFHHCCNVCHFHVRDDCQVRKEPENHFYHVPCPVIQDSAQLGVHGCFGWRDHLFKRLPVLATGFVFHGHHRLYPFSDNA